MLCDLLFLFFFFKQKTAYEMRISDWSSDVCSSDLRLIVQHGLECGVVAADLHLLDIVPGEVAEAQMREGVVVERRRALHIGDALALQPGQCFHPDIAGDEDAQAVVAEGAEKDPDFLRPPVDRKSTRLNSSH